MTQATHTGIIILSNMRRLIPLDHAVLFNLMFSSFSTTLNLFTFNACGTVAEPQKGAKGNKRRISTGNSSTENNVFGAFVVIVSRMFDSTLNHPKKINLMIKRKGWEFHSVI